MKKIGVLLSGAGNRDGSEIQEAVFALLAICQHGAQALIFAPNIHQAKVVSHLSGEQQHQTRNVLEESARIARGNIKDLSQARASDLDALVLPGGLGAALNLSTFANEGNHMQVLPQVAQLIQDMHRAAKPIAAICIAPILLAKILGQESVTLTLGAAGEAAVKAEQMGARHQICTVDDCVVDHRLKVVTTPAYMYDATIAEVHKGITKAIAELFKFLT